MRVLKSTPKPIDFDAEMRMCRGELCSKCKGERVLIRKSNTSYDERYECEDCGHLWSERD
jgi:hypothetical protein